MKARIIIALVGGDIVEGLWQTVTEQDLEKMRDLLTDLHDEGGMTLTLVVKDDNEGLIEVFATSEHIQAVRLEVVKND